MKITFERNDEKISVDLNELFDWERSEEQEQKAATKNKRSIEWRKPLDGCSSFVNDQIITDVLIRNGKLVFKYHMARQAGSTHEYRVPADNQAFIQEAVDSGILTVGKPLWVTIESDPKKHCRWIKIEEI